jgi:hypothetical protein
VSESDSGYNVLGTLKYAEQNVEDKMVAEQIEEASTHNTLNLYGSSDSCSLS